MTQGGLARHYRTQDADTIVVALGSVLGTIKDVIDELRSDGLRIGALGITSFRPFPLEAVSTALSGADHIIVLERALAAGLGGIVADNVAIALAGQPGTGQPGTDQPGTGQPGTRPAQCSTVIAGLGGRAITKASLRDLFRRGAAGRLEPLTFLDLKTHLIDQELERMAANRRSGPAAENMLRDLGVAAARIG